MGQRHAVRYRHEAAVVVGPDPALMEMWTILFSYTQRSVVHVLRRNRPLSVSIERDKLLTATATLRPPRGRRARRASQTPNPPFTGLRPVTACGASTSTGKGRSCKALDRGEHQRPSPGGGRCQPDANQPRHPQMTYEQPGQRSRTRAVTRAALPRYTREPQCESSALAADQVEAPAEKLQDLFDLVLLLSFVRNGRVPDVTGAVG